MSFLFHDHCRLWEGIAFCNGTFRGLLIKDTTALAYSVVYTFFKVLFVF